ncbi:MAG: twin-arginine translocase TatA/TatE family subunit [Phycisphaerae bacterium]|nr:twin-arginine translocase TatA/TatE family subunit [Phycisphaerae bacterium]
MMLGFINGLSPMHLLVIGLVALLLFGNRLPEVMRALGKSINEFKKGMHEVDDNLRDKPPARLSPPNDPTVAQKENAPAKEPVER